MTDAVKGVTAQPVKYEDGQYRRSRLDKLKARALKTSKEARNVFQEEKAKEYKANIPELTDKEANACAKNTMKNEKAAAVVDDRMVYIDKAEMEAAEKAMPDRDHVYLNPDKKFDAKVRRIIADNPEDFYVNGKFSSDQYKRRLGKYTGFDNKANLDEIKTAASDYGVGNRTIRRAMKRAGYEREKDLTWLYKSLAALGVLGAGAGVGALVGADFTSNVYGIHNDGTHELLDTIHTSNAVGVGALRGLLASVIPAIALAAVVKDNGGKDIFNGNTAEEIVAKGEKNIETRISGEKNQKIMKSILKMKNISDEDKAFILQLAYGELTGKKVNDRELMAAYEIAKYCDEHPEIDPKDYDNLPITSSGDDDDDDDDDDIVVTPVPVTGGDDDDDGGTVTTPELCALSIGKNDGVKVHDYYVRANIKGKDKQGNDIIQGDNPYNIVMGKYKRADGKAMSHSDIMALRNDIFGKNKGLKQGNIQLPDTKTVNGVDYVYSDGNVILGTVAKVKLNYFKPVKYQGDSYNVKDCSNNVLLDNISSQQKAEEEAQKIAKENPNKYIFLKP